MVGSAFRLQNVSFIRQKKMPCWDVLPDDLQDLILQHRASLCIQRVWRSHRMFRHARHPIWSRVRRHLGLEVWKTLVCYSDVRREWRQEPASWLHTPRPTLEAICEEADAGLWGTSVR